MTSLAKCLKKIGSSLSSDDAARVKELSNQFKSDGMSQEEADQEAISDVLSEVRGQRANIAKQITKAGGVVPSRGKAAKQPDVKPVETAEQPDGDIETTVVIDPTEVDTAPKETEQKGDDDVAGTSPVREADATESETIGNLHTPGTLSVEERIQQARDNSRILVKGVERGTIKHSADTVEFPAQAAQVLAPIRKSAQEAFYALVLDKDKKPIAVVDHTKGNVDASAVYPGTFAAAVADTKGAASVWLAHNHPSGESRPSSADYMITEKIKDVIENFGLKVDGHVVFGEGGKAHAFISKDNTVELEIKPSLRKKSIPITHRTIRRRKPADIEIVSSPSSAERLIKNVESDEAVILLDTQNKPITSVSLSADEMSSLKDKGIASRLAALVSATNTSAIIVKTKEEDASAGRNIATFAEKLDMRMLDYFYMEDGKLVSDSTRGGPSMGAGDVLFSLGQTTTDTEKTDFTQEAAEKAIAPALDVVSEKAGLTVNVISSDNIPDAVKEKIPEGESPKGFAIGDVIYLVHDNIKNANDARVTFAHEVKGHFGVNNIIEDWNEVEDLYTSLKSRGGDKFNSILDEVNRRNADATSLVELKEFIAVAAERREAEGSIGAFMRKVRELFRKGLTALGIKPVSMTDIDLILSRSEEFLAEGGAETVADTELSFSLDDKPVGFDMPVEKRVDTVIRVMQDKFRPVLMTQKEIAKATGEAVDEDSDAYLAEEAFYGKTKEDLDTLRDLYFKPLSEGLAEYEISREELDEWLIAKHAKERNKQIASINPDMPDGGSGMTNAEADQVFASHNSLRTEKLDELAEHVYGMLEHKRQLMREGLQGDEITDAWEAVYEHYVPLKGMAENEEASGSKIGKGFDIRGKETMRAMGRRSMAESPALHAIRDVTESQIRFRKNEVGNVFLKLVEENPNPNYWEIFTDENPDTDRRIIKSADGDNVQEVPVNMLAMKDKYFATKRDGKTYYIKIADPRLIKALQNMGPEPMGILTRSLGTVTRFLSSMSTTYNPPFMVSNFSRDIQTAVLNVLAEEEIEGGRAKGKSIAVDMAKSVPTAMRAVYASLNDKQLEGEAAEWQKTFDQFREDGAMTGWFDMKEVDQLAGEMERMISVASGGVPGKLKGFADNVIDFVGHANSAVENAVRLSAYKHAIDAGVSRKKAASLAKNLTVNFNRKGEIGAVLNSLYMFANASIQGTATFARAMGTMKVAQEGSDLPIVGKRRLNAAQKLASGLVGMSVMLAILNREMAGEDDDGENWFDKVPGHVRERNLVIMKSIFGGPEQEYYSIPLPYGYNIFHVMGDTAEALVNSDFRSKEELAVHMVTSILGSFAPIGFEQSKEAHKAAIKTITPTVLKPFTQLAVNENFFGGPIYRENFAFGTQRPDSALARKNTKPHWQAISTFMNEVTGGSDFRSGAVDISPDTLGHLFDFTFGGLGRFVDMSVGATSKAFQGEEMDDREIPFLRKVSGKVMEFEDQSRFYDRLNELKQLDDEADSLKGPDRSQFRREHKWELRLVDDAKDAAKELRELRMDRKQVEEGKASEDVKKRRLDRIQERMDRITDRFNKRYNSKKEG